MNCRTFTRVWHLTIWLIGSVANLGLGLLLSQKYMVYKQGFYSYYFVVFCKCPSILQINLLAKSWYWEFCYQNMFMVTIYTWKFVLILIGYQKYISVGQIRHNSVGMYIYVWRIAWCSIKITYTVIPKTFRRLERLQLYSKIKIMEWAFYFGIKFVHWLLYLTVQIIVSFLCFFGGREVGGASYFEN